MMEKNYYSDIPDEESEDVEEFLEDLEQMFWMVEEIEMLSGGFKTLTDVQKARLRTVAELILPVFEDGLFSEYPEIQENSNKNYQKWIQIVEQLKKIFPH